MVDRAETRLRLVEALTRTDGRMARENPEQLVAAARVLESYVFDGSSFATSVAISETNVVQPPQARRGRPPKIPGTDADKDGQDLLA
ncbi:hypothetical protein [Pannonibacter tanglangensis]|uniref:Uncharacterized protein n=1 Tax=Pannonibacter tanglangensis TaxID=2750084 RepID=A0ABW9ZJL3_9HYPH|nr:hypothetical protein [Pannonibacter sp. XCT-34]NBN64132.1 hypothetical protein [Pannonibacter sp. XCT-34]